MLRHCGQSCLLGLHFAAATPEYAPPTERSSGPVQKHDKHTKSLKNCDISTLKGELGGLFLIM